MNKNLKIILKVIPCLLAIIAVLANLTTIAQFFGINYDAEGSSEAVKMSVNSATIAVGGDINGTFIYNESSKSSEAAPFVLKNGGKIDLKKWARNPEEEVFYENIINLGDPHDRHKLASACIADLLITNNTNREMYLTNMEIRASNIELVNKPNFTYGFTTDSMYNLVIELTNEGWSSASNVSIKILDERIIQYFTVQEINFPLIDIGETVTATFLLHDSLITIPKDILIIDNLEIKAKCNELTNVVITGNTLSTIVYDPDVGFESTGGMGSSGFVYGIEFNAEKLNDTIKFDIIEDIPSNETIELPIAFFPNRSCKLSFSVVFYTSDKEYPIIESSEYDMEFTIPSSNQYTNIDMKKFELQDFYIEEFVFITDLNKNAIK